MIKTWVDHSSAMGIWTYSRKGMVKGCGDYVQENLRGPKGSSTLYQIEIFLSLSLGYYFWDYETPFGNWNDAHHTFVHNLMWSG